MQDVTNERSDVNSTAGRVSGIDDRLVPCLRGAASWLWREPRAFLGLNILVIPLLALIYASQPANFFYAPYAKYEPSARADANTLARLIQTRLMATAETHTPEPTKINNWVSVAPAR